MCIILEDTDWYLGLSGNLLTNSNVQREEVYRSLNQLAFEVQTLYILKTLKNDGDSVGLLGLHIFHLYTQHCLG